MLTAIIEPQSCIGGGQTSSYYVLLAIIRSKETFLETSQGPENNDLFTFKISDWYLLSKYKLWKCRCKGNTFYITWPDLCVFCAIIQYSLMNEWMQLSPMDTSSIRKGGNYLYTAQDGNRSDSLSVIGNVYVAESIWNLYYLCKSYLFSVLI